MRRPPAHTRTAHRRIVQALRASRECTSSCPIAPGCRRSRTTRSLQWGDERRTAGTRRRRRGCKHRCRHCPIVPVYDGRFRVVPRRRRPRRHPRAGRGGRAAHHVRRSRLLQRHRRTPCAIVERVRARVRRRVLRRHDQGRASARARRRCCRACATPAARSSRPRSSRSTIEVLGPLEKGHTRADFERVVAVARDRTRSRSRRPSSRSRRGRRSRATATCCSTIDRLGPRAEHVSPIQ